jgi:hypothetical protein
MDMDFRFPGTFTGTTEGLLSRHEMVGTWVSLPTLPAMAGNFVGSSWRQSHSTGLGLGE